MAAIHVPKTGVMTRKGQVTIPAEIRNELDLHEGDKVEFILQGDEIVVRRARNFGERTAGIFAKYRLERPLTIEEEKEAFAAAIVEDVLRGNFE